MNSAVETHDQRRAGDPGHRLGRRLRHQRPDRRARLPRRQLRRRRPPPSVSRPDVAAAVPGHGPQPRLRRHRAGRPRGRTTCACTASTAGRSATATRRVGCRTVQVGSPFGSLDGFATGPGQVTVRGWAIDPDTTGPVTVHVYVDGNYAGQGVADQSRPDVGPGLPGAGPNHGYSDHRAHRGGQPLRSAPTPSTSATARSTPGWAASPWSAATRSARSTPPPPRPAGSTCRGWAIDPDQLNGPIDVQLRLDGNPVATVTADQARPDVGSVYPARRAEPRLQPDRPRRRRGAHDQCGRASTWAPAPTRCWPAARSRCASGSPFGNFEHAWIGPGTIRVGGLGDRSRRHRAHPGAGRDRRLGGGHRHRRRLPARRGRGLPRLRAGARVPARRAGQPTACASCGWSALNVGAGSPSVLGVRQLLIGGNPFGVFEDVVVAYGRVAVAGWALDPDTAEPHRRARVRRRHTGRGRARPNQARPDVGAAYPLYGPNHGFSVSAPISRGRHEVCVFAINQGPGTENPMLVVPDGDGMTALVLLLALVVALLAVLVDRPPAQPRRDPPPPPRAGSRDLRRRGRRCGRGGVDDRRCAVAGRAAHPTGRSRAPQRRGLGGDRCPRRGRAHAHRLDRDGRGRRHRPHHAAGVPVEWLRHVRRLLAGVRRW